MGSQAPNFPLPAYQNPVSQAPDLIQSTLTMPDMLSMSLPPEQLIPYFPDYSEDLHSIVPRPNNHISLQDEGLTAHGLFGPGLDLGYSSLGPDLHMHESPPSLDGSASSQEQQVLTSNNQWLANNWSSQEYMTWNPRSAQMGRSRPTEANDEDDIIEVQRAPAKGARWHGTTIMHCACREYHEPKGDCWGNIRIFPDPMRVRWSESSPESGNNGVGLPDIYRNMIQVYQFCVVDALYRNLAALGIPSYMFCADEANSPFYRAEIEDDVRPDSIVASVQSTFKTLKRDLRPSRTQIARRHHCYIDVFPMPSVRKRLIELQYEIDEDEFFEDAIRGFRCWGSRRESQRDQGHGTGTAWDSRSWEATPEFLKKWECVLGDEDGEIARQSRWWRIMRGEEEDD